jgi:DNA-binding MarR family transcriptional regulator
LIEEVIEEIRRSQSATQATDHAVAELLGINDTDFRCLDIIQRRGGTTAGELAHESGLTTGAVTSVIDRLERAGFARRVSDPSDRRRVLVELTPKLTRQAASVYQPLYEMTQRMFARYSDEQLESFLEFFRAGRELNEELTADLRERLRRKRPPSA